MIFYAFYVFYVQWNFERIVFSDMVDIEKAIMH